MYFRRMSAWFGINWDRVQTGFHPFPRGRENVNNVLRKIEGVVLLRLGCFWLGLWLRGMVEMINNI